MNFSNKLKLLCSETRPNAKPENVGCKQFMTYPKNQFILFLLTSFVLLSCGQNAENTTTEPSFTYTVAIDTASASTVTADTSEKALENDTAYLRLVALVEKEFFKSLKDIDRDFGENNFTRFSKILKKHHKTVYDLYIELSEIKRNAVAVARANGVEIRANGKERVLNNYYYYLEKEMTAGKSNFLNKYSFDNRLMQCFENN